jgi:hypothetical protein
MQDREIDYWRVICLERHVSLGNDDHRGSMSDMSSTFHQSDIPCSKRERLFRGISKASRQREQPQGNSR